MNKQMRLQNTMMILWVVVVGTAYYGLVTPAHAIGGDVATRLCKYDIFVKDEELGSMPLRLNPVISRGRVAWHEARDNAPGTARFRAAKAAEECLFADAKNRGKPELCNEQGNTSGIIYGRWIHRYKYNDLRRNAKVVLCDALRANGRNSARNVKIFSRVRQGATKDIVRECSIPANRVNIGTSVMAGLKRNFSQYKTLATIKKVSCKVVTRPKSSAN